MSFTLNAESLERSISILAAGPSNDAVLVGPSGTGKDTVVAQSPITARMREFLLGMNDGTFRQLYANFLSTYSVVDCSHMKRMCPSAFAMNEYVETAAKVVAGVMLAMTGTFLFFPNAAKDFFPWMTE